VQSLGQLQHTACPPSRGPTCCVSAEHLQPRGVPHALQVREEGAKVLKAGGVNDLAEARHARGSKADVVSALIHGLLLVSRHHNLHHRCSKEGGRGLTRAVRGKTPLDVSTGNCTSSMTPLPPQHMPHRACAGAQASEPPYIGCNGRPFPLQRIVAHTAAGLTVHQLLPVLLTCTGIFLLYA